MTGARAILEALRREKTEFLFGYPGGVVIPFFDELYDQDDVKLVLVRHEQGAAHMADGYARATGRVGVCLATSGPGATNLITGIATAYLDSIPMVAITGQVKSTVIGSDAFQEADVLGITRPITKHNFLVKKPEDLASIFKKAFYLARTGRPGPVLIDVPLDISLSEIDFDYDFEPSIRSYRPTLKGHANQIKKVVDAIMEAKRPLIYAGGGIIHAEAAPELRELVEKTGIPVTPTMLALGVLPSSDPLNLGMLGMHGTKSANMAVQQSDLLIAIGSRFDDRVTGKVSEFAPNARIVHIDIDPGSISKTVKVDIPIVGDAKAILTEINKIIRKPDIDDWVGEIHEYKTANPLKYKHSESSIKPQFVLETINKLCGGEAIIATEVGQNQMWAAQFCAFNHPRTWLSSGGLGTMGYGLPAALGAQAAFPDRLVLDIAGDGSIQMNIQELMTAVQYHLPVKVIILNNGYLGMVRQWQELFWRKRYSGTDLSLNPDFVKIAEAYGAAGIRIEDPSRVEEKLKEAFAEPRPVVVDVRITREENVMPMVPSGSPISKIIDIIE
jgi:acetolactate synthase I/II/III large subunit